MRQCGFTLIEVMIAMFVVALGVGALLATLTSSAESVGHLRNKSFAQWVALNRISEVRLSGARLAVGITRGNVEEYAGARWSWEQEITDQGMAGMLRIEVRVAAGTVAAVDTASAPGTAASAAFPALASAYGFVGSAIAAPSGSLPDWGFASTPPPAPDGGGSPAR
ncbi:MAG: type II secretion system minor pseudopilin GspI [Steroidobacteraceae bacterium]